MTVAVALWHVAPGRAELRRIDLPPLRPGWLRVRTTASGISRGTEGLVFAGKVPPSEHARMRGPFQEGEFPFPVKYGYCAVGHVIDGEAPRLGSRVFALHPHQTIFDVPADAAFALHAELPDQRATLAANLETAINALWDVPARVGDRIAVIGGGSVGLLAAWLAARTPGSRVTVIDPDAGRQSVARDLGLAVCPPDSAPRDCDLVIHASGRPEGLALALDLAGDESAIVELSWYGTQNVALPLGGAFHARRLRLISSQVGSIPPDRRARWTHARRLATALDLLRAPELDALLGERIELADLPAALPRVFAAPAPRPWTVVTYNGFETEP